MKEDWLEVSDEVREALAAHQPVVALESTVIAHGLPYPQNLEVANSCEEAVRNSGAVVATIGILKGRIRVGLNSAELESFATAKSQGLNVEKVGLNNLASVLISRQYGATTVAASLKIAQMAGIQVFSTGGIGGVHRAAVDTFDISADLTALGSTPLICVCAGAKAILDLPKTIEYLETLGVPIVGYGTSEFPAFYSRESGLKVDCEVVNSQDVAELAKLHWETGSTSAVLVCVPVSAEFAMSSEEVERAVNVALSLAAESNLSGKAVTPFLLAKMKELTDNKSLVANRALLINNASVAAQIARSMVER